MKCPRCGKEGLKFVGLLSDYAKTKHYKCVHCGDLGKCSDGIWMWYNENAEQPWLPAIGNYRGQWKKLDVKEKVIFT